MTVKGRFTLDTNILIYAVDRDAGARRRRALDVVRRAALGDGCLAVQALAEFFHAATRKGVVDAETARGFVDAWMQVFPVISAGPKTLVAAMDLVRDHRFSFWDAMLWATAAEAGCAAIVSEDMQDGLVLGGATVINPFASDGEARLTAAGYLQA